MVQAAENDPSVKAGWLDTGQCAQNYCLHAYQAFHNGRGISVISTPANIPKIKSMILALESQLQSDGISSRKPPPFHLSPIPGKGLGLVANTTLHRGDAVMSLPPVLVIHRSFLESLTPAAQHPLLDAAVSHLPPSTQSLFLGQMAHSAGHRISAILATNSFQTDLGEAAGGQHYGNYPEVSRFNHDCRPNLAFRIGDGLVHRTTAVREVRAGEELAITYLDSFEPRGARRARALGAWGFRCGCKQCSLADEEAAESDARLARIAAVQRVLEDWRGMDVTPELIARWVAWYEQERLDFAMAGAYTLAALNYNMLGEEELAVRHARLAVQAGEIEYGPAADDVREMEALIRDPRRHFSWRKRLRG